MEEFRVGDDRHTVETESYSGRKLYATWYGWYSPEQQRVRAIWARILAQELSDKGILLNDGRTD